MPEELPESLSLKKSLSLPLLIFYGVGTMLGLGIYIFVGKVIGQAGALTPVSIILALIVALFSGLSFGELAGRIPKSAGEMNFIHSAFGIKELSALIGWLIVFSGIISTATAINGYVGYVHVFANIPPWQIMTGVILLLSFVAAWGITESAITMAIFTLLDVGALIFIIFLTGDLFSSLPENIGEMVPSFTMDDLTAITGAGFLAFYMFIGFEDMVNVSEEVKNPGQTMPRGIWIALVIVGVIYLLVTTLAVLAPVSLANSDAPIAVLLEAQAPDFVEIVSIVPLITIVNGVLAQIIMGSRVLYGMAEKRMAPKIFCRLNPFTRTPVWSTFFMAVIIIVLALSFSLSTLGKASVYILILVFILCNLSLVVIKKRNPHPEGVKTFPMAVPVIGFLLSLFILIMELTFQDNCQFERKKQVLLQKI